MDHLPPSKSPVVQVNHEENLHVEEQTLRAECANFDKYGSRLVLGITTFFDGGESQRVVGEVLSCVAELLK